MTFIIFFELLHSYAQPHFQKAFYLNREQEMQQVSFYTIDNVANVLIFYGQGSM